METNHIAPPKRPVTLLKTLIVAAGLTCSGAALAVDKIYSCDTCDAQKAEWVAAQHVPEPNCYDSEQEEAGTTQTIYVCESAYRTFIVANPVSEDAFKFRVNYSCKDSLCNRTDPVITRLSINDQEAADLELFYQTDQDFREMMRAAPAVTDISKIFQPPPLSESEKSQQLKGN